MPEIAGVIGDYPHTHELLSGPVKLSDGSTLDVRGYDDVGGAPSAAARMARGVPGFDFDFCDLPIVNYLSARETGVEMTAIPVFLTRRFVHSTLLYNRRVIDRPGEIEGTRAGVSYYGHTDATWARGILAQAFGVDLHRVTWIAGAEEQVANAPLPPNVVHIPRLPLEQVLIEGRLAALLDGHTQRVDDPSIVPMFDDPTVEASWYAETGVFPILHTVVVKTSVLGQHPGLAGELCRMFEAAKNRALEHVHSGAALSPEMERAGRGSGFPVAAGGTPGREFLGPDPLSYGLESNRTNLEMIIRFAREQGVLTRDVTVDELFVTEDG